VKTYVHFNVWPFLHEVPAEAEETVDSLASGMMGYERREVPVPYAPDRDVFIRKVMSAGGDGSLFKCYLTKVSVIKII
jgi:hypothetical protein